ncbi:Exocyst complex protein Exo70 [Macleaya cordata]|uniref:Exocyst subunit Exo70 family protein n=1 Tax=Macleaya cordata TaxID=56857 RepID=A0A200PZC8_MACCD|nr:Exocyst complex protein Exo70 [Macleaya cordata]
MKTTKGIRNIFFSSSPDHHHHHHSKTTSSSSSVYSVSWSPCPSPPRPSTPLHTFSESMMEENIELAEAMITKWNPDTCSGFAKISSLFHDDRKEAKDFLKCVKDLQRAMRFFISQNSNSVLLIRAQHLMQIAMKRLEKEFYHILSDNRDHLDPESISGRSSHASEKSRDSTSDYEDDVESEDEIQTAGDSISEVEEVSTIAMNDLKLIAECMISSGYGKECVKIYKIIRKSIVDEGLYRLGVEQLSASQINKMDWEVLDIKIRNWLYAVKVAVKTLFSGERILCDYVFTSESSKESCFKEISKEAAIHLFQFRRDLTYGTSFPAISCL